MNWWSNLFKPKSSIIRFERGRIEEVLHCREYRIYSEDGSPDSYILLKLEILELVAKAICNEALAAVGNIERFNKIYKEYSLIDWTIQKIQCDRRLTISRCTIPIGHKQDAWILDFHSPSVTDERLLKRVFRAISLEQFVEDSDWYRHILTLNWESFFKEAIGHNLTTIRPVLRGAIRKQEINEDLGLYWQRTGIGAVTATKAHEEVSSNLRIPYEEIAKALLDKRSGQ